MQDVSCLASGHVADLDPRRYLCAPYMLHVAQLSTSSMTTVVACLCYHGWRSRQEQGL